MKMNNQLRPLGLLILTLVALAATGCFFSGNDQTEAKIQQKAIGDTLERHCSLWTGTLSVQKTDGAIATYPIVSYELEKTSEGFAGKMVLENSRSETRSERLSMLIAFARDKTGDWTGQMGAAEGLRGMAPLLISDGATTTASPDNRAISWAGPDAGFNMTLRGETNMDLSIDGMLPLPDDLGEDAVWITARLQREGFRFTLGPFNIVLMECLGIFATLFFASRFLIQWIASERAKRSVVPVAFWWVSLGGALLMMAYGVYFGRIAVVLGQLTGWVVYIRNILLIKRERRETLGEEKETAAEEEPGQETSAS